MDDINTEDFINEIEMCPAVWNSKCESYSNRFERKRAWECICEKFITNFKQKNASEKNIAALSIQKRWRHIRDSYSRELNKQRKFKNGSVAKNHRKYVYFDQLQFLAENHEPKPPREKNNIAEAGPGASTSTASSKKTSVNETDAILKLFTEKMQDKHFCIEDGDRYFLLSLLNDFKKIPESRKMDAKFEIMGTIRRYAGASSNTEDNNPQYDQRLSYTNISLKVEPHSPETTEISKPSPQSSSSENSDDSMYQDIFTDENPTA